jgi:hypothetical protein
MKTYITILVVVLSILSCKKGENKKKGVIYPVLNKDYINNFVRTYVNYLQGQGDTCQIYTLFIDSKFKMTKFYIRSGKTTYFIEDHLPLTYFDIDGSLVFVYSGLERFLLKDTLDKNDYKKIIEKLQSNNKPVVYNPKTWCLNVTQDSVFINKSPSSQEIIEATEQVGPSKSIKFIPPN